VVEEADETAEDETPAEGDEDTQAG
jgi:hypothetical protein